MLKRLAIVVLVAIVLPVYGQKERPESGSDKNDSHTSDGKSSAPLGSATCVVKQEGTAIECNWPESKPKSYFERLRSPENLPNIGLFFVGLGGVAAAAFTLVSINRQAREMKLQRIVTHNTLGAIKEQGRLMKRQADALDKQNLSIRSRERARLVVIFPPKEDPDFVTPWKVETDEGSEMMFNFTVHMLNHGISKAFGVRAGMNFQIRDKGSEFVHDFFMDASVPNVIDRVDEESPVPITVETLIPVKDVDRVSDGTAELFVYGQITYRDVFEDSRIMPFRFVWSLEEWEETDGTQHLSGGWENRTPTPQKTKA